MLTPELLPIDISGSPSMTRFLLENCAGGPSHKKSGSFSAYKGGTKEGREGGEISLPSIASLHLIFVGLLTPNQPL